MTEPKIEVIKLLEGPLVGKYGVKVTLAGRERMIHAQSGIYTPFQDLALGLCLLMEAQVPNDYLANG